MSVRYFLLLIICFTCLSTYGMQHKKIFPGDVYARSLELREAVRSGHCSVVSDLLSRGANVNMVYDHGGLTPLLSAIWCNNLPMVRFLYTQGADINKPGTDGRTPLICAALWGHCEILKYLLDQGAIHELYDQFGRSAWGIAIDRGDAAVARVMFDYFRKQNTDFNKRETVPDQFMYRADCAFAQHSGEIQLLK